MTMAIDPRKGLHRNLNLLEAYKIYEQDYPLFLPDISATLALNSPLFDRINETLTLQSLNKTEFEQDEAQLRAAAMAGGVPLDQLREAFRIFRDAQTPPPPPGGMPAPPNAPPPSEPEPALGPRPGVPTVLGPSLNRVQAQTNAANGERLMAAQVRVAEAQQNVERNRATAASVATTLQGGQTPAQRMTHDLNAAAAAYAASQSHDGAPDAREEMARWILNHQEEIETYMLNHPGVSSENAARDVYMMMTGRPVQRGTQASSTSGAASSTDPAPPTSSATTAPSATPSAELRRRPAPRERDQKRRRRRADQPIDPNSIAMMPAQLFPKKLQPLPEQRIDFTRDSGPRRETQRRPAVEAAAARPRRRSRSPVTERIERQSRMGATQRRFRKKNHSQYQDL